MLSRCCVALIVVLVLLAGGLLYLRSWVRRWQTLEGNLPGAKIVTDVGYTAYLPDRLPRGESYDAKVAAFALRTCISAANRRLGGDMQLPPGVEVVKWAGNRALVLKLRAGLYAVAVSGTLSYEDVREDLQYRQVPFYGSRAHAGFVQTWEKVYPAVRRLAKKNPDAHFLVTGHSLGGAVATLLAVALASDFPAARCALYATATPRTGPRGLVDLLYEKVPASWHAANRSDVVPALPLPVALVGVGRSAKNTNALYANFKRVAFFDSQTKKLAGNHLPTTYLKALDRAAKQDVAKLAQPRILRPVIFS
jgi:dienelactone hydrolase